jgi:hypothetical protein
MNQYDPQTEQSELRSKPPTFGLVRTALLVVTCIFIAVRDIPQAEFKGLIVGAIFAAISWAAIRFRWAYWTGVILSVFILIKGYDLVTGFQTRVNFTEKIIYGGAIVPMLLASIMFVSHLFLSGRLRE